MPTRADLALQGDAATFESVGQRLRELRVARGISIRELARSAAVDKSTVLRVEGGKPVSLKVLNRVCEALSTVLPQITAPVAPISNSSVFHSTTGNWRIAFNTGISRSGLPDYSLVEDPAERKRLGSLGFVTGFMQSHECSINKGTLQAAVMELHCAWGRPARHPGEEFLMCLSGKVHVTIGDDDFELAEGDSVTFRSDFDHNFGPAEGNAKGVIPKVLMVWIEGASKPT